MVTRMLAGKRARFSFSALQTLGDHLILGSHTEDANYCIGVEMFTEDAAVAKGWRPVAGRRVYFVGRVSGV
jgi:type VI secretion system protein ImpH